MAFPATPDTPQQNPPRDGPLKLPRAEVPEVGGVPTPGWALSALCAQGVQGQLFQVPPPPYCESRPQLWARSRRKTGHFGVEGVSHFVAIV